MVNGLGRSITEVHSNQLYQYFKVRLVGPCRFTTNVSRQLSYSSQLFTILALAASRHSVVALIQRLTPILSPAHRYIRLFHAVIAAWTIFAIFGVAFQCGFPAPWIYSPSRCSGEGAVWYPIAITGLLLDIILAFGYLPIVKDVQMDSKKRMTTTGLFLSRLM